MLTLLLELLLVEIPVTDEELVFTIPGVNTTAPISAAAMIAARTPDTITLDLVDISFTWGTDIGPPY